MERELLATTNSSECGWCCNVGSTTVGSVHIFPVSLSILLGAMLLFILVKISINYLNLHRERQHQKILGNSSALYETFNHPQAAPSDHSINKEEAEEAEIEPYGNLDDDLHKPLDEFSDDEELENEKSSNKVRKIYNIESFWKSRKNAKKYPMRWFHFLYLLFAAGWFLLQSLVLLTSGESPLVRLIDTFLYEGHGKLFFIFISDIYYII